MIARPPGCAHASDICVEPACRNSRMNTQGIGKSMMVGAACGPLAWFWMTKVLKLFIS